jgi:hypothetical protein
MQGNKLDSDGIEDIGTALADNVGLNELTLFKNRCVLAWCVARARDDSSVSLVNEHCQHSYRAFNTTQHW